MIDQTIKNNSDEPHPSALEALSMLANIHPQITKSLDHGAFKARAFFEAEGTTVERSLESMLVRYHGKMDLQQKFPEVEFDNLSLCGLSLLCKDLLWKGRKVNCRLRIWKSATKELPDPGDSKDKRIYYTQPDADRLFEDGGPNEADDVTEIKFAILWNTNSAGILQPLYLVSPKHFNSKTGEIQVWWDIAIPDPTVTIKESKAPQKREDLPMERKKTDDKKKG